MHKTVWDCIGIVKQNQEIAENIYYLKIYAPDIIRRTKPGRFVMVKPYNTEFPLLRRAFGIVEVFKDEGAFTVCFDAKGKGTEAVSNLKQESKIKVLGPLGNGFTVIKPANRNIIIAGGMGISPLILLAEHIKNKNKEVDFYYGVRSIKQAVFVDYLKQRVDRLIISSEDGSIGEKGYITEFFENPQSNTDVFCCGPEIMMKKVSEIFPQAYVSMEKKMGCGVGVCVGCVVKTKDGLSKRCCKEGPVFRGSEIVWD